MSVTYRHLPQEICGLIISHLATYPSTLLSLLQTSKIFYAEARRVFYPDVSFKRSVSSSRAIRVFILSIPTHSCAPCIRKLEFGALHAVYTPPSLVNLALRALTKLKVLIIRKIRNGQQFGFLEVMRGVEFRLECLHCPCWGMTELTLDAFSSDFGSEIAELWMDEGTVEPRDTTLPRLHTLKVYRPSPYIFDLVRRRRVGRFCCERTHFSNGIADWNRYDLSSIYALCVREPTANMTLCPAVRFLHFTVQVRFSSVINLELTLG